MSLFMSLLLLIIVARIGGQLFRYLNQPAIVGEMIAGFLLGPTVFNLVTATPELTAISDLAVFFIIVAAGMETNFQNIMNVLWKKSVIIAILGFFIPLISGLFLGIYFHLDATRTLFLALCISITALPVAIRILQSFNLLHRNIANFTIAAAIVNDIAALFLLGILLRLPAHANFTNILPSFLQIGWKFLLLVLIILLTNWGIKKLIEKGIHYESIQKKLASFIGNQAIFGIVILFVLIFGSISEALGFQFIIGAFFAALLLDKRLFPKPEYEKFENTLYSITEDFLSPIFFAFIGIKFGFTANYSLDFILAVLVVSVVSKMIAGWLGGRLIGYSNIKAFGMGVILNARGVMELVIATIAYQHGLIDKGLFSVLVLMGGLTTLITPIIFRRLLPYVLDRRKRPRTNNAP